jgi:adenylyltransferase/sulfurtransferase
MIVPSVSAVDLKKELEGERPPFLLDVREEDELSISRLPGIVHIPLHELPFRMQEIDPSASWVVICRVGGRSAHATAFLKGNGFTNVRNFEGGMNGWAREIDPAMPQY